MIREDYPGRVEAVKEAAALEHVARQVVETVKYWLPTEPAYDAFVARVATAIKQASETARDETIRHCAKIADDKAAEWLRAGNWAQADTEGEAYDACLALDAQRSAAQIIAALIRGEI